MASFNQITLLGHIGQVEVKTFPRGGKIVEATMATSKRWKDRNNETHDETQWHRLIITGPLVDVAERYIKKGDLLFVSGEMTYRKYNNREGVTITVPEVRVEKFQLTSKPAAAQAPAAPVYSAPVPPADDSLEPQQEDLPF